MFTNRIRGPRPQMTWRILGYALVDIFGITLLSVGATWFVEKRPMLIHSFPTSMAEAAVSTIGGLVIMIWAVAHVLKELTRQSDAMQEKYARYQAENRHGE